MNGQPRQQPVPREVEDLLNELNFARAARGLEQWVIDSSANKEGYYSLFVGDGNGIGTQVHPKAFLINDLSFFLAGALRVVEGLPVDEQLPLHLDNDDLEVLQEKLILCAPQHQFRIKLAINQAKQNNG